MREVSPESTGSYRPDIDGLRAVAVLSVIVFHIDKTLLPGGFVGVDLFFVISGFLISRNIVSEIERGTFSILDFYRRRVKRIAPAMFVVIVATLIVAQFVLLPEHAESVAQSALWSSLSLANVYFWLYQDTGYFAEASNRLPLLHLWSLGVEEQFYILWPLVLLLLYPFLRGRYLLAGALLAASISFLAGEALFAPYPLFVYYMLPTRAGELILGALVAIAVHKRVEQYFWAPAALPMALLGTALIGGSLLLLSEGLPFPGLRAIPPTLGAALLILAGHCRVTLVYRCLTFQPLVWVGLISYSAYLWHWPLLAFYRYGHSELGPQAGVTIFALTLALAWLSFHYVEQPVRRWNLPALRAIAVWYIAPAAAITLAALGAQYLDGYGLDFFSPGARSRLEAQRPRDFSPTGPTVCQARRLAESDAVTDRCVAGDTSLGEPKVLLWGDSNASNFVGLLDVFGKTAGFAFRNLAHAACPPILGDPTPFLGSSAVRRADCSKSLELVRAVIDRYQVVVIAGRWQVHRRATGFLPELFNTVQTLLHQGKRVILVGKAPEFQGYDRYCQARAVRYPFLDCPVVTAPLDADIAETNALLQGFAARTANVEYFAITPFACPDGVCTTLDPEGSSYYRDEAHVSENGSLRFGRDIVQAQGVPQPFSRIPEWLETLPQSQSR